MKKRRGGKNQSFSSTPSRTMGDKSMVEEATTSLTRRGKKTRTEMDERFLTKALETYYKKSEKKDFCLKKTQAALLPPHSIFFKVRYSKVGHFFKRKVFFLAKRVKYCFLPRTGKKKPRCSQGHFSPPPKNGSASLGRWFKGGGGGRRGRGGGWRVFSQVFNRFFFSWRMQCFVSFMSRGLFYQKKMLCGFFSGK